MIVRLIIGALMIGAVYSVVGIGYSVIYRASGLMSLCQGDMLMFGAFLGLFFNKSLGLPFPIALLFTTVLMFLLGMGIQKFLVIPLLKKASGFASVILCTLALSYVLQNTALIGWGARMFQFPSIFKTNSINIFGIGVAPENALVLGAAILVMIILHLFMTKTKFGTAMRWMKQPPALSALTLASPKGSLGALPQDLRARSAVCWGQFTASIPLWES